MKLTTNQALASSFCEENIQIIAVAGSGKTEVICRRIINAIKSGVKPSTIVAFTYTEKAANEMKERVLRMARESLENVNGLADLFIGTMHAWALNFLKDKIYGYQRIEILDSIKLEMFINKNFENIGFGNLISTTKKGKTRKVKKYIDSKNCLSLISILRECEILKKDEINPSILEVEEKYEEILKSYNFLDYGMILSELSQQLDKKIVQNIVRNEIKYLIIDEYQDINFLQEKIIKKIYDLGVYVCTVGDDDQTIYRWRGSDISNILNFQEKYSNEISKVKCINLNNNFRSSAGIINLSNTVSSKISERLEKKMIVSSHQEYQAGDIQIHEFSTRKAEDNYIVETIRNIYKARFYDKHNDMPRGVDYGDMAILLRAWKPAKDIANLLEEAGIPYIVNGVNQLFDKAEIKICIEIFKYLENRNEDSLQLIGDLWKDLCPDLTLDNIEAAKNYLSSINHKEINWYEAFNLQKIYDTFIKELKITDDSFGNFVENNMPKGEIVFYNLGMFSQIIQDYEKIHFTDKPTTKIKGFNSFLKYKAKDLYPEGWLNKGNTLINAVTITTIHQAKGLEWPCILLPRMNRNYFPHAKVGGMNLANLIDTTHIKNYQNFTGTLEDELRLLYVAITRSKKFLYISSSPGESKNDKQSSEFLSLLRSCDDVYAAYKYKVEYPKEKLVPRTQLSTMVLNYSLLESYFKCPYSFKYYMIYGFQKPIEAQIGFGKSLHDSLMEIHRRSLNNDIPKKEELPFILDKHINFPYAIPKTKEEMRKKALDYLEQYYDKNLNNLSKIELAESNILFNLDNHLIVNGRIDLVIEHGNDGESKIHICDMKSDLKTKNEELIFEQLDIYALGFSEQTGKMPFCTEIYSLDNGERIKNLVSRESFDQSLLKLKKAAANIVNEKFDDYCSDPKCVCRFKKRQ